MDRCIYCGYHCEGNNWSAPCSESKMVRSELEKVGVSKDLMRGLENVVRRLMDEIQDLRDEIVVLKDSER